MIHSIIILYDFYRIIFNAFWLARIFGPRKVKLIPTFSQRNISLENQNKVNLRMLSEVI